MLVWERRRRGRETDIGVEKDREGGEGLKDNRYILKKCIDK